MAKASVYLPSRETQDCLQTMDIYNEALRVNETSGEIIITPQNFLGDGGIALAPPAINLRGFFQTNLWPIEYNPVNQIVTNGPWTKASVDMTGKFGRSNFFTSIGDERQRGAVIYLDGLHRNNVRLNVDQTMGGNWTAAVRIASRDVAARLVEAAHVAHLDVARAVAHHHPVHLAPPLAFAIVLDG